jgi:hypothetical protein
VKRAVLALAAFVGAALVASAGAVLLDGVGNAPASASTSPAATTAGGPSVVVSDALLVVNRDGSAAVGADLRSTHEAAVTLMGVTVSVDGRALPVNGTQMWLPVPAGDSARVGAASDAGGFVVPDGVDATTQARLRFWFDDGTCVAAEVQAVARDDRHRMVFPTSDRRIGPEVTRKAPAGSTTCTS